MRAVRVVVAFVALSLGVAVGLSAQGADSARYVIRHGADTVAVEIVSRGETEIRGALVVRGDQPITHDWHVVVAPDQSVVLIEVAVKQEPDTIKMRPRVAQRARIIFKGDSAAIDAMSGTGLDTRVVGTRTGVVPYLNLSIGLLEQAIRRGLSAPAQGEVPFFNLGGGQTVVGAVTRAGADSVAIKLGDVDFRFAVDGAGHIVGGGVPAQRLVVERIVVR